MESCFIPSDITIERQGDQQRAIGSRNTEHIATDMSDGPHSCVESGQSWFRRTRASLTQAGSAQEPVSTSAKWIMLVSYSLLIAIRYPWLLLHGRVWAEEGSVYLRSAWSGSCMAALFAPHLGYYALWPNVVSLIAARLVPLHFAALLLTWCSLFIQVLTGYLIVQCEAFPTARIKALALGVLLFTAPSHEVWLNTINSQFYLVLCAVVILISQTERYRIQQNVVLVVAALTGPLTAILAPFFLLRAFITKSKGAYFQASLLTVCAVVQFAVVMSSLHSGVRQVKFQPARAFPQFFVQFVTLPFTGRVGSSIAAAVIVHPDRFLLMHHSGFNYVLSVVMKYHLLGVFCAFADLSFVGLLMWVVFDRSDYLSLWLIVASLLLGIFSIYGSLDGQITERYVFSSATLFGLSLLLAATKEQLPSIKRIGARVLLCCFLLAGSFDYLTYSRWWIPFVRPSEANWYVQARRWERDPNQKLTAWPGWFVQSEFSLPPDHR